MNLEDSRYREIKSEIYIHREIEGEREANELFAYFFFFWQKGERFYSDMQITSHNFFKLSYV